MNCAPHAAPSTGTCARCGAFACAQCFAGTTLCAACRERVAPDALRGEKAVRFARASWAFPLLAILVLGFYAPGTDGTTAAIILCTMCAFGVAFGVAALRTDRGQRTRGVRGHAVVGLILSSVPFVAFLVGVVLAVIGR